MATYISKNVGGKIVKALGLSGVKDFSLHFPMHDAPTIKCEMILSDSQNDAIASVLESEGVKAGKQKGGPIPSGAGPIIVGEGPQPSFSIDATPANPDAISRLEERLKILSGPGCVEKRAIAAVQNERLRGGSLGAKKPATFWQWLVRNFRA